MVWAEAGQINADPALVLHYTFDEDPGDSVQDLSTHGNDGKVVKAEYLDELDGHRGVLRFDGETAMIDCPGSESLSFEGDLSVEMWVRLNAAPGFHWSSLVQDAGRHSYGFGISSGHTLVLWYLHMDPIHGITRSWHPAKGREQLVLPVDRSILSAKWSHIAVVVEYPRCRFYHDGRLVRDARDLATIGIGTVAISSNDVEAYPQDSFDNMKRFAAAHGFPFPYLYDGDQRVARDYGAVCTPDFFGFDRDLKLQYRGRIDASRKEQAPEGTKRDLFEAMSQVAETGEGPREQIPSIGCSIKWKDAA